MIEHIDLETMREICQTTADFFKGSTEPLPEFEAADLSKLSSALAVPDAGFADVDHYPTLAAKAAALWYSLVKNHAFPNGNKRIAVVTTHSTVTQ